VTTKIQLNDEQWKTLLALLGADSQRAPPDGAKVSNRLRSNGLVALDPRGQEYLTDQGIQRLGQGR
jgi:Mn-dependent DtxR family transcriptional regulator